MTADGLAPCVARSAAAMVLTQEQLEMHGCVIIIVTTDVLVLKHRPSASTVLRHYIIIMHQFHTKVFHLQQTISQNMIMFKKKYLVI